MNITLVGFMGTGKTSVGKQVAHRLDMSFVDMDDLIEEREQTRISTLFAERGEPYFRKVERALVRELAQRDGLVIATGGGVVLNPENIADFARSGPVICLSAAPETILRRVAAETHRPLIESDDKMREITAILDKRRALYDAVPHQLDTNTLGPTEVADCVIAIYRDAEGA